MKDSNDNISVLVGDCVELMRSMPEQSVNCCVTSPPYFGLRDYGVDGQIGLEPTPDEFVQALVGVFREVHRVLRDDGTLWLNLGDSYAGYHGNKNAAYEAAPSNKGGYFENQRASTVGVDGLKQKDLIGIPWRVAFALQADGWYLRQDIIWHKPNPMPESVRDRCTKAHEYIFLLSKSPKYYYDHDAAKEISVDGNSKRNRRSVWTVTTKPFKGAHFATFPPDLIEPCILAGCPEGGTVLDPFGGSGTTAGVASANGRAAIICELNPEYAELVGGRVQGILENHAERHAADDNIKQQ